VSTIVTVASLGLPWLTLLGSELLIIVSLKVSFPSWMLSLFTVTLNETPVTLAGNVILYSPEL